MERSYGYPYGQGYPAGQGYPYNTQQYFHNAPSWGYIVMYLIILIAGIVGNALICLIIAKNQPLHRTIHYFLLSLGVMDILICLSVIPFILDYLAKRMGMWELDDIPCKIYICLDYSFKGVHAFTVLFAAYFLYFHYRKNESYATETGEIIRRQSRMHKWAVPLAWVIGIGLSVPSGGMASMFMGVCSAWHQYGQMSGANYSLNLVFVIGTFWIPVGLLLFPLIALVMQLCGARSPRLDPPHNRIAITIVLYIIILIGFRAPHDVYELMKMTGEVYGNKGDPNRGLPPHLQTPETQMALDSLMYLPCLLHPILLLVINPLYREGLKNVWRNLICNKDSRSSAAGPGQNGGPDAGRRGNRQDRYKYVPAQPLTPSQHQPQPIIKKRNGAGGGRPSSQRQYGETTTDRLISESQPMILPAARPSRQPYLGAGAPYIPMQPMAPAHEPLMNSSFDMEPSPQVALPAKFQYGHLTYIDTAREEPKVAYTPTSTPPKTPTMKHFDSTPFKQPNYVEGTWILPENQEAYRGLMPASQIPIEGYPINLIQSSTGPVEVDEIEDPMEIENLDNSPGSTLRTARRGKPQVLDLASSPGARRRADLHQQQPPQQLSRPVDRLESAPPRSNGTRVASPRPAEMALNQSNTSSHGSSRVEVSLTGRSRSRQDLCPDAPRSKFEHAV